MANNQQFPGNPPEQPLESAVGLKTICYLGILVVVMGICYSCFSGGESEENSRTINKSAERYTVVISTTYTNQYDSQVTDTQEMQFGNAQSAEDYARRFLGQPGVEVEIKSPIKYT